MWEGTVVSIHIAREAAATVVRAYLDKVHQELRLKV
jgi:hypothetical protein